MPPITERSIKKEGFLALHKSLQSSIAQSIEPCYNRAILFSGGSVIDTITHAVIGAAIAGLAGHSPSISDPICLAIILGSQAPDIDIIALARGKWAYLNLHRAFSHSLLGVALSSLAISALLCLLLPIESVLMLFLWALAGGVSHILLDFLNTHGAAVFWPISKERKSFPLLNVFDPILLFLALVPYVFGLPVQITSALILIYVFSYIIARMLLRLRAVRWHKLHFAADKAKRLWIMPSLLHLFSWDFVSETSRGFVNGRLEMFRSSVKVNADLPKTALSALVSDARNTDLVKFFTGFSPYIYFEEDEQAGHTQVNVYDLRYFTNGQFTHSATLVYDHRSQALCASYILTAGAIIPVVF